MMGRPLQRPVAATLAFVAGLIVLCTGVALTADSVAAWREALPAAMRVLDLRERGNADASVAPVLHAEYERQTVVSLARQTRSERLSLVLLVAAVAFLVGSKWFLSIRLPDKAPLPLRDGAGGGSEPHVALPRRVLERYRGSSAQPPAAEVPPSTSLSLPVIDNIDLSPVDEIVDRVGRGDESTIPILQSIQTHYRYLPAAALRRVCELTQITPAQLTGVASFYPQFRSTPIGEHVVRVCHGTACHVAGASRISDELRRRLRIAPGQDTDAARKFTLQEVPCLGCCTLAPVVQIDAVTHGHSQADAVPQLLDEAMVADRRPAVRAATVRERTSPRTGEIRLGMGSCCIANGSGDVHDALHEALAVTGANALVKRVGCVGMCHQTPFVEIITPELRAVLYSRVRPEHVKTIVRRHFRPSGFARRLGHTVAIAMDLVRHAAAPAAMVQRPLELRDPPIAAFLGRQKHIATEHSGALDPLDLDEYLAHEGFAALDRCRRLLSLKAMIEQVKLSGLRGRGGAGYPTWLKWTTVREADNGTKYVICNGDEGDPGAFMDRMLMESYPYRVIEGLAIAALAVGAAEGLFYIRAEYPLAVERITEALRRCEDRGLLGGDGATLRLRVVQGAGAFVCGEETAMIASLEGRRGMPTLRPPYPAERGLWGRPTLINNVETYTVVPWIIRNGPEAFAALGTKTSKGTKVFALTGKIQRGGLIEVPMGITIREIVETIGGGVRAESTAAGMQPHSFKAVQIGGPSGGCLPAALADTPVDYEALIAVGAMMGSGGLVVLDETDCMVDIARYFLSFTQNQSCGKCAPCRIGTRRMLDILERLCAGEGRRGDLKTLEHLARMVSRSSLCGLGKTAPNPVLTTLRYFRDEYEAHLEGRCPAGRCKSLIAYAVTDACTGCTLCAQHCPAGAIALRPYQRHEIDGEKCTHCDVCRTRCPEDAIRIEPRCRA